MGSTTTYSATNTIFSDNIVSYNTIGNVTWGDSSVINNVFTHIEDTTITLNSSGGGVDANVFIQENILMALEQQQYRLHQQMT